MPDFSSCHGALGPFKVSADPRKFEGQGTAETGQIVGLPLRGVLAISGVFLCVKISTSSHHPFAKTPILADRLLR